jgi:proteasome accessory factor A
MFGIETEYAVTGILSDGKVPDRAMLVGSLLDRASRHFASLPDFTGGLFLGNGSRFYGDCGQHPEFATPECTNPWDVVRYVLAGEQILHQVATELEGEDPTLALKIFKCNVDYSGARTTWGCHESYLHRVDPLSLSDQIIPHLVTRIIYTGAGGFESLSPGLRFSISPRVQHLEAVRSGHSTGSRGIFHTKDESLSSSGFHRLHLICGESLCSETAMWLKIGTTALVVAMADAGIHLNDPAIELKDPRRAMEQIATAADGKVILRTEGGGTTTAMAVQRHYLALAEAHVHDDFMPPWAEEVCHHWRAILDRLEEGADAVCATLDWAIKLALYRDFAQRQGFSWKHVEQWTRVHTRLRNKLNLTHGPEVSVSVSELLGPQSPALSEVMRLEPYLRQSGLHWSEFEKFLRLRQQLFEVDTRFGQLGPEGVFNALNKEGVLDHGFKGVDAIDHATTEPPASGRARVRGEFIKRVRGSGHRYFCDWSGVIDVDQARQLELSDPFTAEESWQEVGEEDAVRWARVPGRLGELLGRSERRCMIG